MLRKSVVFGIVCLAVLLPSARLSAQGVDIEKSWQRSGAARSEPPSIGCGSIPDLRILGALGNDRVDDTDAFELWWDAALNAGQGYIPRGRYRIRGGTFNLATVARSGVHIWGDGPQRSVLVIEGGGLRIASAVRDSFYTSLRDLSIVAATDGPALELGEPDFSDALNSFILDDVAVNNLSRSPQSVGIQLNGIYASDFRNLVANNNGHGDAIRLRRVQFSRFQGAAGHADVGLHLTEGYNFGNTFAGVDLEELDSDVLIDSPESRNNVFLGNQYVWRVTAIRARAGDNNVFVAPNFGHGTAPIAASEAVGILILSNRGFGSLK